VFSAIQRAGIVALENYEKHIGSVIKVYEERRNILVEGLNRIGWNIEKPKATFYVWAKVPPRHTSATFAQMLLDKADIVVTPGNGFGESGEGYIRMVIRLEQKRLKNILKS
ncbi:MAG: aminotransferase class I/II-fold pyridoxal phosphate-dependent enzyme, partial [Candidatus Thermoplasmatota archaeon]|nr:aminotransferase class I/II-fold pyridoxal phosphate-dependent enzyme [Candidatus Thermoplasmatota archaeon]